MGVTTTVNYRHTTHTKHNLLHTQHAAQMHAYAIKACDIPSNFTTASKKNFTTTFGSLLVEVSSNQMIFRENLEESPRMHVFTKQDTGTYPSIQA